jgi:hypothetical protein
VHDTRAPFEIEGARGIRFGEVPRELAATLATFLDARPPTDAAVLKPGAVWRVGAWAIKRFEPPSKFVDHFRPLAAMRSAEVFFELAPVRAPRPLLAVAREDGTSLLVAEFIDGRFLQAAWRESSAARDALPPFFAELNTRGFFHGDLHARNVIWNGTEWVLIDLEGLRPRIHRWNLRRRVVDQWARLVCALGHLDDLRASFERYADAMQLTSARDAVWSSVQARAARLAPKWALRVRD